MKAELLLFGATALQNASFTFVSRARNSRSLGYHALAAVLSNGLYLLVLRSVVSQLDSFSTYVAYVAGAVVGGLAVHWLSLRLEPNPRSKP